MNSVRTQSTVLFEYRGISCKVLRMAWMESWHNGYMTGPFTVSSYDEADLVASAHGGFTFFETEDDGRITLGFDTMHFFDTDQTKSAEYVTQAIREAVDSLYAAGVVKAGTDDC